MVSCPYTTWGGTMVLCKTRKWGNSLAVVIPKRVVDRLCLKANQEVSVDVKLKQHVLKEYVG